VKLLTLDAPGVFELAASWLGRKENYQWLEFGTGVTPALLKIMSQRDTHFVRVYTSDRDDTPIGICGLNRVNRAVRSATFWGASGDKSFRSRGHGTLAGSRFLTLAFRTLGLNVIDTWVVEQNPSLRIAERLGFRYVGRQRQCHMIDGRLYDRLLFDLLASEHQELDEERWRRAERSRQRQVLEKD
jgi:RimJ/RimL family protein N-acetyltransferase